MNVAINSSLYQQASDYAQSQGLNLTEVIEAFLVRFIGKAKGNEADQPVPDIVPVLPTAVVDPLKAYELIALG